jgi:APA family basic amino acid/polyamine antiporter
MLAAFLGAAAVKLMAGALVVSIFGALLVASLVGARVPYAMANDGLFFRPLARLVAAHPGPGTSVGWTERLGDRAGAVRLV